MEISLIYPLEGRIGEYLSKCTPPRPMGKDVLAVQTDNSHVMQDSSLISLHTNHKKRVTLEFPSNIPAFTADPTVCMWALCYIALHEMGIMYV